MKIILYSWSGCYESVLERQLTGIGHEVVIFLKKCIHYSRDLNLARELINLINDTGADAVISYNYFPIISMVCNTVNIPYYSWIFDSPHHTLYAHVSSYKCNHIFDFDKASAGRLNKLGIKTVSHMPLGVDWEEYPTENKDYCCDVSFVGSLYTDRYNHYDAIDLPEKLRDKADIYIEKQCFDYEFDQLKGFYLDEEGQIDEGLLESLKIVLDNASLLPGDDYIEDIEHIFTSAVMEKKVTVLERRLILNAIAEERFDFRLYTGSPLESMPALKRINRGYVDYYTQMPLVFANSRINLNISLRSIRSGIPMRAMDILGCGGFLLSNYQSELAEYFEEGKEVVLFRSMNDCIDKIRYYLSHENERIAIAKAGHKAVMERFNYKDQLVKILNG